MTRKCSHCGHNGHNSRTCPNRGVKIFGVRLTDGPIRKSASMGNLLHYSTGSSASASNNNNSFGHGNNGGIVEGHVNSDGYLSDGLVHNSSSNSRGERKKGVPWTEEEHRMFLIGLQKLGKGDWRGISRNFVPSRTPTQVASHAQKYFIRQSNLNRRKRRSSLFDITTEGPSLPTPSPVLPVMSSHSNSDQEEPESFEISSATTAESNAYAKNSEEVAMTGTSGYGEVPFYQGFVAPYVPFVGFPMWSPFTPAMPQQPAPVYRPTAVVSTAPMKVDDCSGLSQLSLGDNPSKPSAMEPSELSLKLHDQPSRQSAFQATPPINDESSFNSRTNVISVV